MPTGPYQFVPIPTGFNQFQPVLIHSNQFQIDFNCFNPFQLVPTSSYLQQLVPTSFYTFQLVPTSLFQPVPFLPTHSSRFPLAMVPNSSNLFQASSRRCPRTEPVSWGKRSSWRKSSTGCAAQQWSPLPSSLPTPQLRSFQMLLLLLLLLLQSPWRWQQRHHHHRHQLQLQPRLSMAPVPQSPRRTLTDWPPWRPYETTTRWSRRWRPAWWPSSECSASKEPILLIAWCALCVHPAKEICVCFSLVKKKHKNKKIKNLYIQDGWKLLNVKYIIQMYNSMMKKEQREICINIYDF